MNVAALPLCQELYDLSDWEADETDWVWSVFGDSKPWLAIKRDLRRTRDGTINPDVAFLPAYDLGYLLRQLPPDHVNVSRLMLTDGLWCAEWYASPVRQYDGKADAPEDALAKLCISLFTAGVLARDGDAH